MAKMSVMFPVINEQDLEASLAKVTAQVLQGDTGSEIADRENAYAINREYDRIRDILMENRKDWERFQGIFWYRKYHSCRSVHERLNDSLKEEYMDRIRREYKRAMQIGQLDQTLFTAVEWKNIRSMINRSEGAASMLRAIPLARRLAPLVPRGIRSMILKRVNGMLGLGKKLLASVRSSKL